METGDCFYALCRSYNPQPVGFSDEREIRLGIEEDPLVVQLFYLFRTKNDEYVARLDFAGRDNGVFMGIITDCVEQRPVMRTIPMDDLVRAENVTKPVN